MRPLKIEYDSKTGEATFFVGAARESIFVANPESDAAIASVNNLHRLLRFAYSQGALDAAKKIAGESTKTIHDLILEQ